MATIKDIAEKQAFLRQRSLASSTRINISVGEDTRSRILRIAGFCITNRKTKTGPQPVEDFHKSSIFEWYTREEK